MLNDKSLFTLNFYSIFDKKNNLFQVPFSEFSDIDAARRFNSYLNNHDTIIGNYKDDFALYKIGILDLKSGDFVSQVDYLCDFNSISSII